MKKGLVLVIAAVIILLSLGIVLSKDKESTINQSVTKSTTQQHFAHTCSGKPLPDVTEGPYYTAGSPEKTDFRNDVSSGTPITITGFVLDTACQPIAHAWLDFWQADSNGVYDNSGYNLRGHQYTDDQGKYTLTTILPGEYPGRTPHIHVKLRAKDASPITTVQLYFPENQSNGNDAIFTSDTLVRVSDTSSGKTGQFDFVINK